MLELLQLLVPSVVERCQETSALGSMARAQDELKKLKLLPKTVETTDHLMVDIYWFSDQSHYSRISRDLTTYFLYLFFHFLNITAFTKNV